MLSKIITFLLLVITVVSAKSLNVIFDETELNQPNEDGDFPVVYLTAINSQYYVTNITVGTPPQTFVVGFTSAIANTFIPSISCETCQGENLFDDANSSTFISTEGFIKMSIDNPQKTTVKGKLAFDTINLAGCDIERQQFGNIIEEDHFDFPFDGMISLSFNGENFIYNMHSQGLISSALVGYYINSDSGEVSFGEANSDLYSGNISYFKLDGLGWTLPTRVRIGHTEPLPISNFLAVFNVGVENIQSGPETTRQVNEILGGQKQDDGSFAYDCSVLDLYNWITFVFDGQYFMLGPRDYIQVTKTGCISYFVSNSLMAEASFLLGQPFFRAFYTVFDFGNETIGFASAIKSMSSGSSD